MPPVYNMATKTARMTAVKTQIDAGSGNGVLVLMTAANAVLASIALQKPSGTVTNDILTFSGMPLVATATGSGVAAKAEIRDSAGTAVVTGLTVGGTAEGTAAGKDIVLNASTISTGQTVTASTESLQHAA